MKIDNKELIFHMIDNVNKGIEKINKHKFKNNTECSVFILVPDDEYEFWKEKLTGQNIAGVISGDENDVFSRYEKLFRRESPNYIMRLTADCPFIPHQLITKTINTVVNRRLDYLSNVDEDLRTMPDGFDVEIMSNEAFCWLMDNIYAYGSRSDLEHVTTYLRANKQGWMKFGILSYVLDMSDTTEHKYSVDTKEDFDTLQRIYVEKIKKDLLAKKKGYGVYDY